VQFASNRFGVLAALAIAAALGGCANTDFDTQQGWFAKRTDWFGRSGGYTYSDLGEQTRQRGPIGPSDLVDAGGGCAPVAVPAQAQPESNNQASGPPGAADSASLLGGGVGLGMTECEVVYRAGQPTAVELGSKPTGERTATLRFAGGPRAGVYRFEAGRLTEMDRVETPPPPPTPTAKKKPVKPRQTATQE
jgi:hypothetical protein